MDHHGHKFLKLFFYLNNVEIGCGHHEYCCATHRQDQFDELVKERDNKNNHFKNAILSKRKFGGNIRLDHSLIQDFIPDKVFKIGGKAGTSFIEDTRGLHRGTLLPDGNDRTIFQVLYVPNINHKDKPLGLAKNQALEKCYENQTYITRYWIVCSQAYLNKQLVGVMSGVENLIIQRVCLQILIQIALIYKAFSGRLEKAILFRAGDICLSKLFFLLKWA